MSVQPRSAAVFDYLAERIHKRPELSNTDATIQFDITGEPAGSWVVDLTTTPGEVRQGTAAAPDCVITMRDDDFVALTSKELNPVTAYMQGKIQIRGDMNLVMKLQKILGY